MALGAALLLGGGGAGCATSHVRGSDVVWSVDTAARRITIGDRAFTVTPETRLFGRDGERLTLYEVPSAGDAAVGMRRVQRAQARYRATPQRGWIRLDSLRVAGP